MRQIFDFENERNAFKLIIIQKPRATTVAQLVEKLLLMPVICGSSPVRLSPSDTAFYNDLQCIESMDRNRGRK